MATRRESGVGEVLSRSSSADLSSPPRSSPEPGSPSAQFAKEISARRNSSITVNPSGVPPAAPEKKERKKPGRKPKVSLENGSSATNTDAPKKRAPRKPRDPNAPTRKRKTQTATSEVSTAAQVQAIVSPERLPTPTPKITETKPVIRDSSFEVRPDTQGQPPSQNGKHEDIPNQPKPIHSFFNVPPPPPPQQQQPVPSQPQHSPLPLQYVLFPSRSI